MIPQGSAAPLVSLSASTVWVVMGIVVFSAALAVSLRDRRITLLALSFCSFASGLLMARLEQWIPMLVLVIYGLAVAAASLSREARTAASLRALFGIPLSLQSGVALLLAALIGFGFDVLISLTETWLYRRSAQLIDSGQLWSFLLGPAMPLALLAFVVPVLLIRSLLLVRQAEKP